jgi:hypothetical protein
MKNNKHATDQKIILALLEHVTQERAAAALGICTATIRRRSDKPEFQAQYLRARSDQLSLLRARAQQAVPSVLQMFLGIMGDPNAKAGPKLQACISILRHANTFELEHLQITMDDMEEDIDDKEKMWGDEDDPLTFHLEKKFTSPPEIKHTVRKRGASAAKIDKIVFAMIQHRGNREKVALECKLSRETVWRWLQKPEVRAQYRKELNAIYLRGMAMMQQATEAAFAFIEHLMKDNNIPASVRLQCGNSLLHFAKAGADLDLRERRDALRARKLVLAPELSNNKHPVRRQYWGSME